MSAQALATIGLLLVLLGAGASFVGLIVATFALVLDGELRQKLRTLTGIIAVVTLCCIIPAFFITAYLHLTGGLV